MDVKSLKGIAVVSIADGEKVGTVDETLFDTQQRRLVVFRLSRSNILRGDREHVRLRDVRSIGRDAVMIENRDAVRGERDIKELKSLVDLKTLASLRVVTESGHYVGNLATVQFDKNTGAMTVFEVSGPSIVSVLRRNREIPSSEVISIGSDVIVVPNSYGPQEEEEGEDMSGDRKTTSGNAETEDDSDALPLPQPRQ
jgi:uncharacterized protein YrrD